MKFSAKSLFFIGIIICMGMILFGICNLLGLLIINDDISIYHVFISGLIFICFLFLGYIILKQLQKRKSLFDSIHKGTCKTCHKTKLLNSNNECFFCWDKSN